jgi:hypothetical protein
MYYVIIIKHWKEYYRLEMICDGSQRQWEHLEEKNSLTSAEISTATIWARVYSDSSSSRLGGNYMIDLKIKDVVDLVDWQFSLYFNPTIFQYLTVEEDNFLKGMKFELEVL